MLIGETTCYRGRLDENCCALEVNSTLSVVAVSWGFKKFTYFRGFCVIKGHITEVQCIF
jgi:hypothetical protein